MHKQKYTLILFTMPPASEAVVEAGTYMSFTFLLLKAFNLQASLHIPQQLPQACTLEPAATFPWLVFVWNIMFNKVFIFKMKYIPSEMERTSQISVF